MRHHTARRFAYAVVLRAARARGKKLGRPRKLDEIKMEEICSILNTEYDADRSKIAAKYQVHERTLERALNELEEFTG